MIFKTLTLNNIFSYYGEHPFDLAPPANTAGNIVIIKGRNGFGKTSFLNSVKLLFGGVTKELRQSVQRDREPSAKCFVVGDKDWWGILNHKAKSQGQLECSVAAVLLDEHNREIEIVRRWDLGNDNAKDTLWVKPPRSAVLEGEQAQQYLSGLLPLDYIPFFFFDAEEVGYLAEANRNQVIEKMEQLLNIRPVDNLNTCLKDLKRKIENEFIAKEAKQRLLEAENKQKTLQIQHSELLEEQQSNRVNIELLEEELRDTRQKIKILSGQGVIENNAKLEATKQAARASLEHALTHLSDDFERDAFLRLNALLVQKALPAVEQCANSPTEMLLSLHEPLKDIFTTPPYPEHRLSESQVLFYQRRISKLLDSRDVGEDTQQLLRLDNLRAKKLLSRLSAYLPQRNPETAFQSHLTQAWRAETQINEVDKALMEVRQLSDENRQQLEQLQDRLAHQQEQLFKLNDQTRAIEHRLAQVTADMKPLESKITELRKQARQSEQGRRRIELLEKMQQLLAAYKQALKEQQRGKLEAFFNQHLHRLLDSNALIAETKIDEFFQLHYLDANGAPVAMSSISAGMKQIAATALLWALKDACGRQIPVILDSPLGRIDRQHQENLLTRYYPKAAKQVILLPTDSELDERKYQLLKPYIYQEFELLNPDGQNTQVTDITRSKAV